MIRKTDYFKLGLFTITGTILFLAVIIILGAGRYFKTDYLMETYINESVNGLEVGSPVKLKGVSIGRVAHIGFVVGKYVQAAGSDLRYVYVECEIDPGQVGIATEKEFKQIMSQEVAKGLRVRPATLGLTGQIFLNVDYFPDDGDAELPIEWKPEYTYIPAVPSTLNRVEQAVASISSTLSSLKKEDLEKIVGDAKEIVGSIREFLKTKGAQKAGRRLLDIMAETHTLLARVNEILSDPATERLIPETTRAIAGIRSIVEDSRNDIVQAASEAKLAMASMKTAAAALERNLADPRVDKAMSKIGPTLENISRASQELTIAVGKVHGLVNRLNGVVATEEGNIHAIINDVREVMDNIKELSGDAKRYPSGVLFGQPPRQTAPETP